MSREAGKGDDRRRSQVPDEIVGMRWDYAFKPMSQADRRKLKELIKKKESEWEETKNNVPHIWR